MARSNHIKTQLQQAQNPKTKPGILSALSRSRSKRIVAALTQNPSMPLERLLALAEKYPTEFLQNPLIPLLLLEEPTFLHQTSAAVCRSLLQHNPQPSWLLPVLLTHPDDDFRAWMAMESTSEAVLAQLSRDSSPEVRSCVAENPMTAGSLLESLSHESFPNIRAQVACHPNAPLAVVERLATDPSEIVCLAIIRREDVTSALLDVLAQHRLSTVHQAVAAHPRSSADALERLAEVGDVNVSLAAHPNASPRLLLRLSRSKDTTTRFTVAKNPNTPKALIHQLAQDEVSYIRFGAAQNPRASAETLLLLAKDALRSTRVYVAQNPSTPYHVMEELQIEEEDTRCRLASDPNAPQTLLSRLANDESVSVRINLSKNPSASPEVLALLANDANTRVRFYTAKHPNLTPELRQTLSNDKELLVRKQLSCPS
jgi:hypothetical protein